MQDKGLITAFNTLLGGVGRILLTPLELLLRILWLPVLVVDDLFDLNTP